MDAQQISTGILYHVTIGSNVDNIWASGIDPNYSTGKLDAAWYITKENILWAICHVASRHGCLMDDIFVCSVLVEHKAMRGTCRKGIYYTKSCFFAETINPAAWFIDQESSK